VLPPAIPTATIKERSNKKAKQAKPTATAEINKQTKTDQNKTK
jgi:hypothetical protein